MARNLVIVESPAKARTVSRFLGKDYQVKASLGHVRDLPPDEMGVDVKNGFRPRYILLPEKQAVVRELKQASREASIIFLATDPDREGEAIAWHLVQVAGWRNRTVQRVVFHEITPEAVKEAFRNPRAIDMPLVNAQQARRVLDRLVGYHLSPLLWRKVQGGLSAGRVQSVALRMVVDRERLIRNFVPQEYWSIKAQLKPQDSSPKPQGEEGFTATLNSIKGRKTRLHIPSGEEAEAITRDLEGAAFQVAQVKEKEARQRPAPPFTTSTLQQEAWRKLRFSAKKTMAVAQQLYEGLPIDGEGPVGLITYMRTDSTYMAPSAVKEMRAYIREKFGAPYLPGSPRSYVTKAKAAQEAHECIRPTSIHRHPDSLKPSLSPDQWKLYELIWKRSLASQMSDALSAVTTVEIEARSARSHTTYIFRASGSVLKFPGFQVLYREDRDEEEPREAEDSAEPEAPEGKLPPLHKGEILECLGLQREQHFTKPPPRYTEATLVKALEEKGIGRPSTYAPILSTIQERGYVSKKDGHLYPSTLGEMVNDLLVTHFPTIMDPDFTAHMEEQLDQVARGEKDWQALLKEFYPPFHRAVQEALARLPKLKAEESTDENCPECGRPLVIKSGRRGRFISCSGFPRCRFAKPLLIKTGAECPRCGGDLVERRGRGKTFFGCSNYPTCNFATNQKPLPQPCPECGGLLVAYGRGARCTLCQYKGEAPQPELVEV